MGPPASAVRSSTVTGCSGGGSFGTPRVRLSSSWSSSPVVPAVNVCASSNIEYCALGSNQMPKVNP